MAYMMPMPHMHGARLHGSEDPANSHLDDLLHEAARLATRGAAVNNATSATISAAAPVGQPAPEQSVSPVVLVEGFFSFFNEVSMMFDEKLDLMAPSLRVRCTLTGSHWRGMILVLLGPDRTAPQRKPIEQGKERH